MADDSDLAAGQERSGPMASMCGLPLTVFLPSRLIGETHGCISRRSTGSTAIRSPKVQQEMHHYQRIHARAEVVHHDAGAFGEPLQPPDWRRLRDIEDTEKYKARREMFSKERDGDERDELPGDLIDDDILRVFLAASAGYQCGGGNADGVTTTTAMTVARRGCRARCAS